MHVWENGLETITLSRKAWLVYSHVNEAEKIKASLFLFHMRGYAFLLSCRRILCISRITFNGIIVIITDHLHAFITLTKCLRVLRQFFIFCKDSAGKMANLLDFASVFFTAAAHCFALLIYLLQAWEATTDVDGMFIISPVSTKSFGRASKGGEFGTINWQKGHENASVTKAFLVYVTYKTRETRKLRPF